MIRVTRQRQVIPADGEWCCPLCGAKLGGVLGPRFYFEAQQHIARHVRLMPDTSPEERDIRLLKTTTLNASLKRPPNPEPAAYDWSRRMYSDPMPSWSNTGDAPPTDGHTAPVAPEGGQPPPLPTPNPPGTLTTKEWQEATARKAAERYGPPPAPQPQPDPDAGKSEAQKAADRVAGSNLGPVDGIP